MTVIYGASGEDGRKIAWPLLAHAAALHWGWTALPAVERSPRGKPRFTAGTAHQFSLSHSGGLALCALSDGPVGVDIEAVRPRKSNLPQRLLSPRELERSDGSWEDFFRLWTLKESWCKREDVSLYPPQQVETPPPCPHKSYAGEGWQAAVCCDGTPPEEIVWLDVPGKKEGLL